MKGTIGQGLINVFTPVLKVINSVIGKLQTLANAFLAVTNLFAGKKKKSGGMGAVVQEAEAAADAVGGAGRKTAKGAAGAAKKAAKDMAKAFSIDELNIVTPEAESGGSGGGAGGAAGMDMGMEPVPVDTTVLDTL